MFAFHRQPLKAVYLAYFLVTTVLVRLPMWTTIAAIPRLRPRRSWSFRRTLIFYAMVAFIRLFFDIGFPVSLGQNPEVIAVSSPERAGFAWAEPLAEEQIVGELKELAALAVRSAGYWFANTPEDAGTAKKAANDEKVIMHLHSTLFQPISWGAVMGLAHPKGGPAGPVCNGLLQHCPQVTRVFSCGYRLSSSVPFPVANPFPAGVLDSLAGYNYLIHTVGFQPQNVFICGDSAGGNLAISLVRYLANNALSVLSLPVPRGLILVSPSVEWGITHDGPKSSWRLNAGSDYSGPFFQGYILKSLLGNLPVDMAYTSPWISPASLELPPSDIEHLFQGFPATFILSGEAELARDSIRTFNDRLCRDIGKDNVTYKELKDVTHDVVAMRFFEPERTVALTESSCWLEKMLA
ncbi:Alpha/Beta hydrolase protein [Mycena rosella]|uniref:Alpha/Beta hydrolase protein n=1 Tax=Mycena rosella TaxID=1033263 RepID=A0AAD7GE08_MYCRO|nr:Alpha/Beta hydrolase protein [Mycena rosella]